MKIKKNTLARKCAAIAIAEALRVDALGGSEYYCGLAVGTVRMCHTIDACSSAQHRRIVDALIKLSTECYPMSR